MLELQPGFVAVSYGPAATPLDLAAVATRAGIPAPQIETVGSLALISWGMPSLVLQPGAILGTLSRRGNHDKTVAEIETYFDGPDDLWLRDMLPPFAAARRQGSALSLAVDMMGYRQVYQATAAGIAAIGTTARVVADIIGARPNREALAIQSMLGWQIGRRTLFEDVDAVDPGTVCTVENGSITTRTLPDTYDRQTDLDAAVRSAADVLGGYLESYLDEHPEAVLQLTGGQDSRILLSAVPKARRPGLRSATLAVPGNEDTEIAARLSAREGLHHTVVTLRGLDELNPEDAHDICLRAAVRLDGMADPLALASLTFAEQSFPQGDRISGIGGECARGFYYFGPLDLRVTPRRVHRLAGWRMFANESVGQGVLDPDFMAFASDFAHADVYRTMSGHRGMREAGDEFYYQQRMRRWGGLTDTAVCYDRAVANPMLDRQFLDIARGMPPSFKSGSRFLAQLQMVLDPGLGSIPMDERPAPSAYASRSVGNMVVRTRTVAQKGFNKVRQRVAHSGKPPAGGTTLTAKVVSQWRSRDALQGIEDLGVVRPEWLQAIRSGAVEPSATEAAMLVNLEYVAASCRLG